LLATVELSGKSTSSFRMQAIGSIRPNT